ncbi:LeuA family protein [Haliangium ochraceum]|uniref:2-isopropylmalate synthase n=1 Tax=Haliangium ochraceum (strain DSM 14365 / JCM 11303 / SMP-2) TaxID=502025 RepID=D0LGL9_HALO1|nr:LeuA family protein [Haliangium ochraceum]ACY12765.1 2-isopropylmalate synthase [Haliangium ochraceum DSM 14365]
MSEATEFNESELIYDWNSVEKDAPLASGRQVSFLCETLRDGIQSPSVVDPDIGDKLRLVELADSLGIHHIDIGLPGAGNRAVEDCTTIATFIRDNKLRIRPACAARTHKNDVGAIVDISQAVGIEIEVLTFIGSSPIRQYAESWDLERMLNFSSEAIDLAARHNLPVTFVTEDTTRSRPEVLDQMFRNAIEHGANRLCLCDTVGHSTPDGIHNLIRFTRNLLEAMGRPDVGIDWHGHNDRGLGVVNTIFAIEYGASRVHGTAMGLGERVGNAALDQVLLNLKLLGELPEQDLSKLLLWCKVAAKACHVAIPPQYPLAGSDAFRTATGVHAAAIIKAEKKGHEWLADRIYSGVPAGMFGREQEIEIGHYSGESNVIYWLRKRGFDPTPELVRTVLSAAKRGHRVLSTEEILQVIKEHNHASGSSA